MVGISKKKLMQFSIKTSLYPDLFLESIRNLFFMVLLNVSVMEALDYETEVELLSKQVKL